LRADLLGWRTGWAQHALQHRVVAGIPRAAHARGHLPTLANGWELRRRQSRLLFLPALSVLHPLHSCTPVSPHRCRDAVGLGPMDSHCFVRNRIRALRARAVRAERLSVMRGGIHVVAVSLRGGFLATAGCWRAGELHLDASDPALHRSDI